MLLAGQFTTSTAPWWFVATLSGGALILGSFLALLSAKFSDKRRSILERERMDRAEREQRRTVIGEAASRFLFEAREHLSAYETQYEPDWGPNLNPAGASGFSQYRLKAAGGPQRPDLKAVYKAYWDLVFISSEKIGSAARDLWDVVRWYDGLFDTVANPFGLPVPLPNRLYQEKRIHHIEARQRFVTAVKSELGADAPSFVTS